MSSGFLILANLNTKRHHLLICLCSLFPQQLASIWGLQTLGLCLNTTLRGLLHPIHIKVDPQALFHPLITVSFRILFLLLCFPWFDVILSARLFSSLVLVYLVYYKHEAELLSSAVYVCSIGEHVAHSRHSTNTEGMTVPGEDQSGPHIYASHNTLGPEHLPLVFLLVGTLLWVNSYVHSPTNTLQWTILNSRKEDLNLLE